MVANREGAPMGGETGAGSGRTYSQILGLGGYRPERVVDNHEVAERLGLDPEWIRRRSGIQRRRYANSSETVTVMAAAAAAKALAAAGVEPAAVGCVIVATGTHLKQFPAAAVEVAHRMGANGAAAFDLTAACAGFPYALATASGLVCHGGAEYVVVVGAERMTDVVDRHDAATGFLFADGAGAVVVGRCAEPGISPVVWGADHSRSDAVGMTGYWVPELRTDRDLTWPVLAMSGWRVYRWATEHLAGVCERALDRAGVSADELDAFIPHQANALITAALARRLGLPARVVVADDISESGNTSAASIPLAMEQLMNSGRLGSGATALLVGFGSGIVYAAQVVRLP
jgi:3-oxoacyl-[acyl-carrier-protein] synthase-3